MMKAIYILTALLLCIITTGALIVLIAAPGFLRLLGIILLIMCAIMWLMWIESMRDEF